MKAGRQASETAYLHAAQQESYHHMILSLGLSGFSFLFCLKSDASIRRQISQSSTSLQHLDLSITSDVSPAVLICRHDSMQPPMGPPSRSTRRRGFGLPCHSEAQARLQSRGEERQKCCSSRQLGIDTKSRNLGHEKAQEARMHTFLWDVLDQQAYRLHQPQITGRSDH